MELFECHDPGCDASSATAYSFHLRGVGTRGQDIRIWFDRRYCARGHYNDVEVFEEDVE